MPVRYRRHLKRQKKLETLSKFILPIPLGIMVPVVVTLLPSEPFDAIMLVEIPFLLIISIVPVGFLQIVIGLPSISILRGRPLILHVLTGVAVASLAVASSGLDDLIHEIGEPTDSVLIERSEAPVRFSGRSSNPDPPEFTSANHAISTIYLYSIPMVICYSLVWMIFTWSPRRAAKLRAEDTHQIKRPVRTLREVVESDGTLCKKRHGKND